MLRLIDRINRKIPRLPETKDIIFVLNIVPVNLINDDDDIVQIIGHQYGQSRNCDEQFNIDKLYYTDEIATTIVECIAKSLPLKVACVKYRKFNNLLSKMYNTWKVVEIQKNPASEKIDIEWIQTDQHSKIF